jgi:hypothetical protein
MGMREVAQEALTVLRHKASERMENSQYRHFRSRAKGAEVVVLPARDHDRIGCLTDQVKLTHALVEDLDEAIKQVKLLGEHEQESSQKIMELEALCKWLRQDAQKLREEKATIEGIIESHDELILEITRETVLDSMGEDAEEEEENEDADDGGDATTPLLLHPLLPHLRRSSWRMALWRWFPSMKLLWRI